MHTVQIRLVSATNGVRPVNCTQLGAVEMLQMQLHIRRYHSEALSVDTCCIRDQVYVRQILIDLLVGCSEAAIQITLAGLKEPFCICSA